MHEGNEADRRTRSRERNLRILRKAVGSHPDEPYFPYRLGCESLVRLDDEVLPVAGLGEALAHLDTAWTRLARRPAADLRHLTWAPDLGVRIASGLLAQVRCADALRVVGRTRELFPDHPAVLLQSAAVETRDLQERHGSLPTPGGAPPAGVRPRRPAAPARGRGHGLGRRRGQTGPRPVSSALPRRTGPARRARSARPCRHFEQALELDPAYSCAWLGMAECSRFAGDRKRAMKLYLRTVTESEWNHRAWFRGCDLMVEMGFHDNAASWRRSVVDRFPEHPQARAERAADLVADRGAPLPVGS